MSNWVDCTRGIPRRILPYLRPNSRASHPRRARRLTQAVQRRGLCISFSPEYPKFPNAWEWRTAFPARGSPTRN